MFRPLSRFAIAVLAVGTVVALAPVGSIAQPPKRNEIRIAPIASGEELAGQHQLWVLEVYMKPMRLIPVELTDPRTGEKKLEFVWYITYRAVHRTGKTRKDPNDPQNEVDSPISPPLFIPEFTLVMNDNERNEVYADQIIPEALAAINKREKGIFKTSVEAVGPLPAANDPGQGYDHAIQGVAMWRGLNPDADRYTLFMGGFSNGFRKIKGPDDEPIIQTKTIMQKYIRRGDRFDQNEDEILLDGESQWIYR